jgi:type IV secretory pathway protease TraF
MVNIQSRWFILGSDCSKRTLLCNGDNRDQSADSRFWGFVPEENLTGRAFYVWMHKEPGLTFQV